MEYGQNHGISISLFTNSFSIFGDVSLAVQSNLDYPDLVLWSQFSMNIINSYFMSSAKLLFLQIM